MAKLNIKVSEYGPISKKVLSDIKKSSNKKVVDLSAWKSGKLDAENLEKTIISNKQLSGYDPLHGVYFMCRIDFPYLWNASLKSLRFQNSQMLTLMQKTITCHPARLRVL